MNLAYKRIAATGELLVTSGPSVLGTVNVNTGGTGATLSVYDGTSTSGALIATIDAGSKSSHGYFVRCASGIYLDLNTANADITVGYA